MSPSALTVIKPGLSSLSAPSKGDSVTLISIATCALRSLPLSIAIALLCTSCGPQLQGGDWPHYSSDSGSTKYAAIDQIDSTNFSQLKGVDPMQTDQWGDTPRDLAEEHEKITRLLVEAEGEADGGGPDL